MDFGTNPLDKYIDHIYRCIHCRYCSMTDSDILKVHGVCPTYAASEGFEDFAAAGYIAISRALLEENVKDLADVALNIFSCTGCGNCREQCMGYDKHFSDTDGLPTPDIVRSARMYLRSKGVIPKSIEALDRNVETSYNSFNKESSIKDNLKEELKLSSSGDVLIFTGCYSVFGESDNKKDLSKIKTIVEKSGYFPAYSGSLEWCCGTVQYSSGNLALFETMAKHNINVIKESGAEVVVTPCAGCANSLRNLYNKYFPQSSLKVLHITEFISDQIKKGSLKLIRKSGKVTYHDPCHLGKHMGVYEEPREVIKASIYGEIVEMEKNRKNSWCCGGGEGVTSNANPKLSGKIAMDRAVMAEEAGAEILLSACPECVKQLTTGSRRAKLNLKVSNILDWIEVE